MKPKQILTFALIIGAITYFALNATKQMKKIENNKTYFVINDYNKLKILFGDLLREIQRIKSQGDYKAGKDLIENYGVKVDPILHKEILARYSSLNIAPYAGFIQPKLLPVMEGDKIIDVKIKDFGTKVGA